MLLLTHPSVKVLRNFRFLVANKILDLPGLELVGVYHERALRNWHKAQAYLQRNQIRGISLRRVRCRLSQHDVFRPNPCSSTFRRLVRDSHGVVFTGGPDLPPALYGRHTRPLSRVVAPRRHFFEASFLYHLIGGRAQSERLGASTRPDRAMGLAGRAPAAPQRKAVRPLLQQFPDYAVLAICLGMETLNVAAGGTLLQDIPSQLYGAKTAQAALALPRAKQHACYEHLARSSLPHRDWKRHPVRLTGAWTFTAEAERDRTLPVISAHHQAIDQLGPQLTPLAYSIDGKVVEALSHARFPGLLGVQFHPEYSKAFVAQRECGDAAGLAAKPTYQLDQQLVRFYQRFWKSFAQRLGRSRARLPSRAARLPATASVAKPKSAQARTPLRAPQALVARHRMGRALALIRQQAVRKHGRIDAKVDPHGCGVIGTLVSPITSKTGILPSKQATCDPRFAAIMVKLLRDAGLKQGDAVGLALSGSFPALNIATLVAAETLGLKPIVVSSASASMFGANTPELTWLDMEAALAAAGLISTRSIAATLGARNDNGTGLSATGRRMLERAAARAGVTLLRPPTLQAAVRARLGLYRRHAGSAGLKGYVNVGGGHASVGSAVTKAKFHPGLNLEPPKEIDQPGVMSILSHEGLPVIHLGNIRKLCNDHGLPVPP